MYILYNKKKQNGYFYTLELIKWHQHFTIGSWYKAISP